MRYKFLSILVTFLSASNFIDAQWIHSNGPQTGQMTCLALKGSDLYAGFEYGGLYKSTDDGFTWNQMNIGNENNFTSIWSICVKDSAILINGAYGLSLQSLNDGQTWIPWNSSALGWNILNLIIVGDTIMVNDDGDVSSSTDNGVSWITLDSGLASSVNCIAYRRGELFAATASAGIYHSFNFGNSWTSLQGSPGCNNVSWIATYNNNVYAYGTGDGAS